MTSRIALSALSLSLLLACGSSASAPTSSAGGSGGFAGGSAGGSGGGSGGGSAGGSGGGNSGGAGGGQAGGGSAGGSAGGSGGGSGAVDPPEYVSGSRLRARSINTADGAKQLLGWQDKQLGIACQFLPSADGTLRCLPSLGGMPESISGYYADSRCTQKLGILSSSACGAPQYDYEYATSSACTPEYGSEGYRLFHAGAQFTGQLYFLSGSTCTAVASTPSFTYWLVGAEADYTQFVSGSVATE